MILVGLFGYGYGLSTEHASPTALIPAAFGLVLLILGVISMMKDGIRKHLMHVAVLIALIGFVLTAGRLVWKIGETSLSAAFLSQLFTALICLVFVVLSINSFIAARKNRGQTT